MRTASLICDVHGRPSPCTTHQTCERGTRGRGEVASDPGGVGTYALPSSPTPPSLISSSSLSLSPLRAAWLQREQAHQPAHLPPPSSSLLPLPPPCFPSSPHTAGPPGCYRRTGRQCVRHPAPFPSCTPTPPPLISPSPPSSPLSGPSGCYRRTGRQRAHLGHAHAGGRGLHYYHCSPVPGRIPRTHRGHHPPGVAPLGEGEEGERRGEGDGREGITSIPWRG